MFSKQILNPFFDENDQNSRLSKFQNDCKNLEYYKIFSLKNNYNNLNDFKMLYCFSKVFFIFCKKGLKILEKKKLEIFLKHILDLKVKMKSKMIDIIVYSLYLMQGLILKENWVGSTFISEKYYLELEKINFNFYNEIKNLKNIFEEVDLTNEELENWNFGEILKKTFIYNEEIYLREYLAIDGEEYQKKFGYKTVFILKTKILEILNGNTKYESNLNIKLLLARAYNLHTKILANPTMTLKKKIQNLYGSFLTNYRRDLDFSNPGYKLKLYSFVKLEYAIIMHSFYKFKKSKQIILETMSLLGIEITFKGKYGIKTTPQNCNLRQFTVEIQKKRRNSFRSTEGHSMEKKTRRKKNKKNRKSFSQKIKKPTVKKLCDIFDNILQEKPYLEDYTTKKVNLTLEENIVILALITNMIKANPMEEILREKIMAFLNKSIESYNNWSVLLIALIYRSKLEFAIKNKRERAMIQFEEIVKDWHSNEGSLYERTKYIFFLNFPTYTKLIKYIANSYVSINCFNTASSLLTDYDLYSEALEISKFTDKKNEVITLIDSIPLIYQKNPEILCRLGDLYKEPNYYYNALEITNNKCKLAFLSLGLFYLKNNNLEKSLFNFQEAFNLNELCLKAWNNTGYIYMKKKEYESAIICYSKSIELIDTQSEIWGNLAILFRFQKNLQASFNAITKAVELNDKNWKIWINYLVISWELKKFEEYIKGIRKFIILEHPEEIKDFMVKRINFILQLDFDRENIKNVKSTEKINKKFFKKD